MISLLTNTKEEKVEASFPVSLSSIIRMGVGLNDEYNSDNDVGIEEEGDSFNKWEQGEAGESDVVAPAQKKTDRLKKMRSRRKGPGAEKDPLIEKATRAFNDLAELQRAKKISNEDWRTHIEHAVIRKIYNPFKGTMLAKLLENFNEDEKAQLVGALKVQNDLIDKGIYNKYRESYDIEKAKERKELIQEEAETFLEDETEQPFSEQSENFLKVEEGVVTISQLKSAYMLIRLKHLKMLEDSPDDEVARMQYLSSDAIVTYLSNMQKAIKSFLSRDPKNKTKMFYGQPVRGLDGEGDLIVSALNTLDNLDSIGINEIVGETWGIDIVEIPWTDVDNNKITFDAGRNMGETPSKYLGRIIPASSQILNMYILDKYRDGLDENGEIISGKEMSSIQMAKALEEDSVVAVDYAVSNMSSAGMGQVASNILELSFLKSESSNEEVKGDIYKTFLELSKQILTNPEIENKKDSIKISLRDFLQSKYGTNALRTGWLSSLSNLVTAFESTSGLIFKPESVFSTFNKGADKVLELREQSKSEDERIGSLATSGTQEELSLVFEIKTDISSRLPGLVEAIDREMIEKYSEAPSAATMAKFRKMRPPGPYQKAITGRGAGSILSIVKKKYNDRLQAIYERKLAAQKQWLLDNPGKKAPGAVKKPASFIKTLIEICGQEQFPDVVNGPALERQFQRVVWSGKGDSGLSNGFKISEGAGGPPVHVKIGKALRFSMGEDSPEYKALEAFTSKEKRPMKLEDMPEGWGDKVRAKLEGKTFIADERGSKEVPLLPFLEDRMASGTYNTATAKMAREILGSEHFNNPLWKKEFEESLKMSGDLGRSDMTTSHEKIVGDWYKMISEKIESLLASGNYAGFPDGIMRLKQANDSDAQTKFNFDDSKSARGNFKKNEYKDAIADIRNWIAAHRGEPGAPHSKVRPFLEELFPEQAFVPEMAQGLFAYLGQGLQSLISLRTVSLEPGSDEQISYVESVVLKDFPTLFERGIEEGGTEGTSAETAGDKVAAHQQVKKFIDGSFQNNFLRSTVTRVTGQERKYERETGKEHKRPYISLDTHSASGFVQQMMGYSLSPGLEYKLTSNEFFENWFAKSTSRSFGHQIGNHVKNTVSEFWKPKINPYTKEEEVDESRPKSKREFIELAGAFADPLWAFAPLTTAFETLEMRKRTSEAILDNPDTAENHFWRVMGHLPSLDPNDAISAAQRAFDNRVSSIFHQSAFANVDKKKAESYLIVRYKSEEHQLTNNPFSNWNPEQMGRLFNGLGVTNENLELLFENIKRDQDRRAAIGDESPSDIPNMNDPIVVEDVLSELESEKRYSDYFNVTNIVQARNFFRQAVDHVPSSVQYDVYNLGEKALLKLEIDFNRGTKEEIMEKSNAVFGSSLAWQAAAKNIIGSLDVPAGSPAKEVFYTLIAGSDFEVSSGQNAEENLEVTQNVYSEVVEAEKEAIVVEEEVIETETPDVEVPLVPEEAPDAPQEAPQEIQEPSVIPDVVLPGVPESTAPAPQEPEQPAPQGNVPEPIDFGIPEEEEEEGNDARDKFSKMIFHSNRSPKTAKPAIWEEEGRLFFE